MPNYHGQTEGQATHMGASSVTYNNDAKLDCNHSPSDLAARGFGHIDRNGRRVHACKGH
jgi:hypothetical protein